MNIMEESHHTKWLTLREASQNGEVEVVKLLLENDTAVDEEDSSSTYALLSACANGHTEVARLLLGKKSLPNAVNCTDEDGETPLYYACQHGRLDTVRMLISKFKADVDIINRYNNAPLHKAALNGKEEVALALINEFDCNINLKGGFGRSVLHNACEGGHLNLVRTLILDHGADVMAQDDENDTPLHIAALNGKEEVALALINEFHCSINLKGKFGRSVLHYACEGGNLNLVRTLILDHGADVMAQDDENDTPLNIAALTCKEEVTLALINEFHCNINLKGKFGRSVLHDACNGGNLNLVQTLIIDHGADVMARDDDSNTPLHIAALTGKEEVALLLINDFGCDIRSKNAFGQSVLHYACYGGNYIHLVRSLIVDIQTDMQDNNGVSALMMASEAGYFEVAKFLLDNGAQADLRTKNGTSALMLAQDAGHTELVDLLQEYGAEVDTSSPQQTADDEATNPTTTSTTIMDENQGSSSAPKDPKLSDHPPKKDFSALDEIKSWFRINIKTISGKTTVIDATTNDKIKDIKLKIQEKNSIPLNVQLLSYNGKSLEDNKSLADYLISEDSDIVLMEQEHGEIKITVIIHNDKVITLPVKTSDTIETVQQKICDQENISSCHLLCYQKKRLDNKCTLVDYCIGEGSELELIFNVHEVVKFVSNGEFINLNIEASETIEMIKRKIYDIKGIAPDQQFISFSGRTLENDEILSEYTKTNNIFDLTWKMKVTVRNLKGEQFIIEIISSDTIKNVKCKISDKSNIPVSHQRLICGGKSLDSNKCILDYGIAENSVISLVKTNGMVIVKTVANNVLTSIYLAHPQTVKNAIKMIQSNLNISFPSDQIILYFKKELIEHDKLLSDYNIVNGSEISIQIHFNVKVTQEAGDSHLHKLSYFDTVGKLKDDIEIVHGVPTYKQLLMYEGNELKDTQTCHDIALKEASEIFLNHREGICIKVETSSGNIIQFVLPPFSTVAKLKSLIEEKEGIPISQQNLFFREKLKDCRTLISYKVRESSTIHLTECVKITVFTKNKKHSISLCVEALETIKSIKLEIEKSKGIPITEQTLKFNSKKLINESTISDCNIKDDSTIELVTSHNVVVFSATEKKVASFTVDYFDTIECLKTKIESKWNICSSKQELEYNNNSLENDCILLDYGLLKDDSSCIMLHCHSKEEVEIRILQTMEDKDTTLKMKSTSTIRDVKSKIAEGEEGLALDTLQLCYDQKALHDDKTLLDYEIESGSVLTLEVSVKIIVHHGYNEEDVEILMDGYNTIKDIKLRISSELDKSVNRLKMKAYGKKLEENDRTLCEYGIKSSVVFVNVHIDSKMDIFISNIPNNKDKLNLAMEETCSVKDIKSEILKAKNIQPDQYCLYSGNQLLEDGDAITKYPELIIDGSTLRVEPFINIYFTEKRKSYVLKMLSTQKVSDIKSKIENEHSILMENKCLIHLDTELDQDNYTLSDCGINKDTLIILYDKSDVTGNKKKCTVS